MAGWKKYIFKTWSDIMASFICAGYTNWIHSFCIMEVLPSNETSSDLINKIGAAIPKSTPLWFFLSLIASIIWTVYLAYYNSRVIGVLAKLIINKFYKYGHINIGKHLTECMGQDGLKCSYILSFPLCSLDRCRVISMLWFFFSRFTCF